MNPMPAWVAQNVLLPLLPAVLGAAVRGIYDGYFHLGIFDAGEMAFSAAMIWVITLGKVHRLKDDLLRKMLEPFFVTMAVLCVVTFAGAVLLGTQVDRAAENASRQVAVLAGAEVVDILKLRETLPDGHIENSSAVLYRIRMLGVILTVVSVPIVVLFKHLYKLED